MRRRASILLAVAACASCATTEPARLDLAPQPPREPLSLDPLAVSTLLSEWRSVRDRLRLDDARELRALHTDGTHSLSSTEWPVFARVYFALASCDLAALEPDAAARTALDSAAADALLGAIDPRRIAWIHEHFGDPLVDPNASPSVIVHGPVLFAIERCGESLGSARLTRAASALRRAFVQAFERRADGVLPSYRAMTWVTDSLPALAALSLDARRRGEPPPPAWARWRRTVESYAVEPRTGLIVAPFNSAAMRSMGPPRGSALLMALPYMTAIDEAFARAQWNLCAQHLLVSIGELSGAREFPLRMEGRADADSGRIVWGMGESASGFAILAAASVGDTATATRLARSAWAAAAPERDGDRVRCPSLPTVGHAILLAGKTALVRRSHAR